MRFKRRASLTTSPISFKPLTGSIPGNRITWKNQAVLVEYRKAAAGLL
jgi:hypothetical protein